MRICQYLDLDVLRLTAASAVRLLPRTSPHFFVLGKTSDKNLFFYHHIFNARMCFAKIIITADILIEDFGGQARSAVLSAISVFLTPSAIGRLLADSVLCHF